MNAGTLVYPYRPSALVVAVTIFGIALLDATGPFIVNVAIGRVERDPGTKSYGDLVLAGATPFLLGFSCLIAVIQPYYAWTKGAKETLDADGITVPSGFSMREIRIPYWRDRQNQSDRPSSRVPIVVREIPGSQKAEDRGILDVVRRRIRRVGA
jgi:hypothetical protein